MTASTPRTCFVSAPFGRRSDAAGLHDIDFDDIYQRAIAPAARNVGLEPVRADALTPSGTLDKAIYEMVLNAPVMLVDISSANPNMFYELGLRLAVARRGTLVICADTSPVPFDLGSLRVLRYSLESGVLTHAGAALLKAMLSEALPAAAVRDDSPIFTLFPGYSVTVPQQLRQPAMSDREGSDPVRRGLLEATRTDRSGRPAAIRKWEEAVLARVASDPALVTDLLFAYRDASAWDEVVRLSEQLPVELAQLPLLKQQLAMALNRRGQPGDRDRATGILKSIVAVTRGDPETFGMLGRIYKDRYRETKNADDLTEAIDYYGLGYAHDASNYYTGINLLTLLKHRGDALSLKTIQARAPELREALQRDAAGGRADYWNVATRLELACIAGEWDSVEALTSEARLRAPAPWMLETTAQNLRFLEANASVEEERKLERVVKMLLVGMGAT